MKHQSACYATKANHTTRTIRHRECEELIQSLTEALFTYKRSKTDKSNTTKNCHPRPSWEDIPNIKKYLSIFQRTFYAAIFYLCVFLWNTAAKDAHEGTLPTRTSLSKDKKFNVKINKGTCTAISP